MPSTDIVQVVIDKFLAELELKGKLNSEGIAELKRLAAGGALSDREAIEAALKKEPLQDDQAKEP